MKVSINGQWTEVTSLQVLSLLSECGYDADKIAVAINSEFIPRSNYADHAINDRDHIDVLSAVQGG